MCPPPHTHSRRGKLDNLANGVTAEDLSHTIGHPGGSCVQWKSVTYDLWCWKAVVDRYSIPVRALRVWPWLRGFCVWLRIGTIHIFSVDLKKKKENGLSSVINTSNSAVRQTYGDARELCRHTQGKKHVLHVHTMCSVCCFSHRGTFSLRVECRKEGQMGQQGSEWNRSWLRNAGGVFGGLEWSLGSKGGLTCRVGWVIRGWQLRADPPL